MNTVLKFYASMYVCLIAMTLFCGDVFGEGKTNTRGHQLSYQIGLEGAPSDFKLPLMKVHQVRFENKDHGFFIGAGISHEATFKDGLYFGRIDSNGITADNTFKKLFLEGGAIYSINSTLDLFKNTHHHFGGGFTSYKGATADISIYGFHFGYTFEKLIPLQNNFAISLTAGAKYENLNKASVNGVSDDLDETISGLAPQFGLKLSKLL